MYFNGAEVWRDNMPTGAVSYATAATATIGGTDETNWLTKALSPSALIAGWNTLAAEIHQTTNTSSDVGFNFELTGTTVLTAVPALGSALTGSNLALTWPAEAAYFNLYSTTNLTPPITWTFTTNPAVLTNNQWRVLLPLATNTTRFYRLQGP